MTRQATGVRLSHAMAAVIARALAAHEHQAGDHRVAVTGKARTEFLEGLESHLTPYLSEMWAKVANDESMPDHVRELAREIAEPNHQFTALLQFAAAFLSIFSLAGAISRPLAEKLEQDRNQETPHMLISPQELALGVVKGVQSPISPSDEALKGGYDAEHLAYLEAITGEPLSLQDLLFLRRRGHIDDERLIHGIRQSRVKNEWIDAARALEYIPISAQEAVVAVLKGHLSHDEGRKAFTENGIEARWFDVMVHTAGRPPGAGEMLELYRRKEITRERLAAGIRQSDINNDYLDEIEKLAIQYPPPRSVPALVKAKAITKERGIQLLEFHGYPADLARSVIAAATHEKGGAVHALSESHVHDLYTDHLIDKTKATALLDALRYDAEEIALVFELWDHARQMKYAVAAAGVVRSRYVSRHIDRAKASADLDALHVPQADRDQLIRLWDMERDATTRSLTEAQITAAWSAGLPGFDDAQTQARLETLGLSADDAQTVMALAASRRR